MAKSEPVMADMKPEPIIRLNWPKDAQGGEIKVEGAMTGLALGRRVRVTVEGTTTGYAMQDWGCSIDVKGRTVRVEDLGEGEPMTEAREKSRARKKGA